MPIKSIEEQRVTARLLIYSFLFFKLSLGLGLYFEFRLRGARVRVWVKFRQYLNC